LMLHFVQLGVGVAVVNGCVRTDLPSVPIVDLPAVPYYAIHRRGALADPRCHGCWTRSGRRLVQRETTGMICP
jgi:DNA-binding transcriptional LysR family regulator